MYQKEGSPARKGKAYSDGPGGMIG